MLSPVLNASIFEAIHIIASLFKNKVGFESIRSRFETATKDISPAVLSRIEIPKEYAAKGYNFLINPRKHSEALLEHVFFM